jgi:ABC-type transport system involved in cytochrome bd biosynthesis fused ATPase/permease subunit
MDSPGSVTPAGALSNRRDDVDRATLVARIEHLRSQRVQRLIAPPVVLGMVAAAAIAVLAQSPPLIIAVAALGACVGAGASLILAPRLAHDIRQAEADLEFYEGEAGEKRRRVERMLRARD